MNSFSSRSAKTISIPHDPPHEVTIQKLAGRTLQKADEERDFAVQDYVRRMGGREYREQVAEAKKHKETKDQVEAVQRDPVHAFDQLVVVKGGVKGWTFTEDDGTPIPVTPEAIEDLAPDTLEYLAREILRYTKPTLFTDFDKEAAKAAQREAHADSPVTVG